MSYYYCRNCGDYMDEMEATCLIPEIHYELENKPVEMIVVNQCIYCGSDDLVEAGFTGEILHRRDPDRKIAGHDPLCGIGNDLNRPGHSKFPSQKVDGGKEYRQQDHVQKGDFGRVSDVF